MQKMIGLRGSLLGLLGAAFVAGSVGSPPASAAPFKYHLSGYFREYLGLKLEDSPDFGRGAKGKKLDGAGKLIMARSVFRLDLDASYGDIRIKSIGRVIHEAKTPYLKDLQQSVAATGGNGDFVDDEYEDGAKNGELRELYAIIPVTRNLTLTLGKQQVAWGEGDFFRTADIIHGNNLRWRPEERENEETRNPLWLANAVIDFPAIESQLQLIYRPGWDSGRAVVNLRDIFGGRGQQQPFKGFDFTATSPQNFDHSTGDVDDANYGARWLSRIPGTNVDYTLLYYRGLWRDGVTNSAFNPIGTPPPPNPALIGETIHPFIDTWGLTYNIDIPSQNLVLRGEATYVPNRPFNFGSRGFSGLIPVGPGIFAPVTIPVPGLAGIKEKQVLSTLWAFDWNVDWTMKWLKTQRQSLWTIEIFDDWILDHHSGDDLVQVFGNGATAQEHHTIFTTTLNLNYDYDNIQPGLALLYDVNYGDVVFVPSINYRLGDHWRIFAEANIVLPKHTNDAVAQGVGEIAAVGGPPPVLVPENDTHLLGLDGNNSRLTVRLTYQF